MPLNQTSLDTAEISATTNPHLRATSARANREVARRPAAQLESFRPDAVGTFERFDVKLAAAYAGVCASVIYGLCAARVLPHYRLGGQGRRGKIVIQKADLDAYLADCRVEPKKRPVIAAPKPRLTLRHLRLPS